MEQTLNQHTIAAVATPPGSGGIAVIRVSGPEAIEIVDKIWRGKRLTSVSSHSTHLGNIVNEEGEVIDNCLATVFKAPNSFTGEDVVELSVHGSIWIQHEMISMLCNFGATPAGPGEFSQRAFMNGKIDLAQAEGIADLIAASSKAAHTLAVSQTRGEFSRHLEILREQLIELASLMELELDFSEEEVEFADRNNLQILCDRIIGEVRRLTESYRSGKAIKEGIQVTLAGLPNVGKSTLLNNLLQDDRAIVSNIPGTTRDLIEDTTEIDGVLYRFTDTAGLRSGSDDIEKIGIQRAIDRIGKSAVVLWMLDATVPESFNQSLQLPLFKSLRESEVKIMVLINKVDVLNEEEWRLLAGELCNSNLSVDVLGISAKGNIGIAELKNKLREYAIGDYDLRQEIIISNARHYDSLRKTGAAIRRVRASIEEGIPTDIIVQDIREACHHIGTITGSIPTETLLQTIFSRFCIGK